MENIYLLPIVLVFFLLAILGGNSKPMSEEDSLKLIEELEEKQKTLNQMNFLISEIWRISKEKSKAIKANDWDHLKKLHEEEDRNRITFDYLANKN